MNELVFSAAHTSRSPAGTPAGFRTWWVCLLRAWELERALYQRRVRSLNEQSLSWQHDCARFRSILLAVCAAAHVRNSKLKSELRVVRTKLFLS
jgi:hypothetical protein